MTYLVVLCWYLDFGCLRNGVAATAILLAAALVLEYSLKESTLIIEQLVSPATRFRTERCEQVADSCRPSSLTSHFFDTQAQDTCLFCDFHVCRKLHVEHSTRLCVHKIFSLLSPIVYLLETIRKFNITAWIGLHDAPFSTQNQHI